MKLMIHKASGAILDAKNEPPPDDNADPEAEAPALFQVPAFAEVVDTPGDAETFAWPHPNGPSACLWDGAAVITNPAVPLPGEDPLTAEEVFDMLKAKNVLKDADRPRPRAAKAGRP